MSVESSVPGSQPRSSRRTTSVSAPSASLPAPALSRARRLGRALLARAERGPVADRPLAATGLGVRTLDVLIDDAARAAGPGEGEPSADLQLAQRVLIDSVLEAALVRRGHRVLVIGSGTGRLAVTAARRGAHVTTIVEDRPAANLVGLRAELAGVCDLVDVVLGSVHDVDGLFDAVVAVDDLGISREAERGAVVARLCSLLAPAGLLVIQAVTAVSRTARRVDPSLRQVVSPGELLSTHDLRSGVAERSDLLDYALESVRGDYLAALAVGTDALSSDASRSILQRLASGLRDRELDVTRVTARRDYTTAAPSASLDAALAALVG